MSMETNGFRVCIFRYVGMVHEKNYKYERSCPSNRAKVTVCNNDESGAAENKHSYHSFELVDKNKQYICG